MKRNFNLLFEVSLLIAITVLVSCTEEDFYIPELITFDASEITTNAALSGGFISNDGGDDITARGLCWSTSANPSISDFTTTDGTGMGKFTSTLDKLDQNTLYYARAYATNSKGTAYGNEIQFSTSLADKPIVVTIVNPQDISYYNVLVTIHITGDGGTPVTEKGICWATTENPTVNDERRINDETFVSTKYVCFMSPLLPSTSYHVRAYAINCIGISYGNDVLINTPSIPEITTGSAMEITNSTARIGGNVKTLGNAINVEVGICYGTGRNPTIEGTHISADFTATGEFICNLTNLQRGTLYYARAYVAWDYDEYLEMFYYTVYGDEIIFTTDD